MDRTDCMSGARGVVGIATMDGGAKSDGSAGEVAEAEGAASVLLAW